MTASATLYIGAAPQQPESGGDVLQLYNDNNAADNAYWMAIPSFTYQNLGSVPLDAKLTVASILDVWFQVVVSCSGGASCTPPPLSSGDSDPGDYFGNFYMACPGVAVNEIGQFKQAGDSVTIGLCFTPEAAVATIATALLDVLETTVPGGFVASPKNLAQALPDLMAIKSVLTAANDLVSAQTTQSPWAYWQAFWDMEGVLGSQAEMGQLAEVLSQLGVTATDEELQAAVGSLDMLNIVASLIVLDAHGLDMAIQGLGTDLNCTFYAYDGTLLGPAAVTSSGPSASPSQAVAARRRRQLRGPLLQALQTGLSTTP